MSAGARGRPGGYARAVEEALGRLRERPVVLSPREWPLVSAWWEQGIPLGTVLEVLDEAATRSRAQGREMRSLVYAAPAVEEARDLLQAGRSRHAFVHAAPAGERSPRSALAWERAREALGQDEAALRRHLDHALAALAQGADPRDVDERLDGELARLVAPPRRARADEATLRALQPFRDTMPAAAWSATLARGIVDRLRKELGLERLT